MNIWQKLGHLLEGAADGLREIFGFANVSEMFHSLFMLKFLKVSFYFAGIVGFMDVFTQKWLGMSIDVYGLFITGLFIDMILTIYIVLFIHNKRVEKSKLMGKTMLKVIVYSFIFAATFRFQIHFADVRVFNLPFDLFDWLHSSITMFCFLQLILGLLKKTSEAGFEEVKGLPKFIRDKMKQLNDGEKKEDK